MSLDFNEILSNKIFDEKRIKVKELYCEAIKILRLCGVPFTDTPRRHEKMIGVFLALGDIKNVEEISKIKDFHSPWHLTTRKIIDWENSHLDEHISSGSYDDIRRKDLTNLLLAEIVIRTEPSAATNDSTRGYSINPRFSELVRTYWNKAGWENQISKFNDGKETLENMLLRKRALKKIPIKLPNGTILQFSSGNHNALQKSIVEIFLPIYGYGAEILYIGDTADKYLVLNEKRLKEFGFPAFLHDELPDIVCYSKQKDWIYLIEAVYTSGPISEKRLIQLKKFTRKCTKKIVFVTCFNDMKTFRKYSTEIAWETEVWIFERPEHLIHFNGDKFIGPHVEST